MQWLDEFMGHPDTEQLAVAIKGRYDNGKRRIFAYPDPSGRARKTSAMVGRTDFAILESHGIRCLAHNKAPSMVDSVNAVNGMLHHGGMLFDPIKCPNLILSMERTKWVDNNPNTATIDKKDGVEHFSDGVRYATEYLHPIRVARKATARGFNF
jgi:hypothetical protein